MRHSKDPCENQKPSAFTYMTETIDVTLGTNQPSMTQINAFKIQVPNPQAQSTEITNLPSPPSPILKRTTPSPTVPVTITSTPIDAENIICIEGKTIWAQKEREQRGKTDPTVSPPKTAPATAMTTEFEEITDCPSKLPEDLDVIKEFINTTKMTTRFR